MSFQYDSGSRGAFLFAPLLAPALTAGFQVELLVQRGMQSCRKRGVTGYQILPGKLQAFPASLSNQSHGGRSQRYDESFSFDRYFPFERLM